MFTAADLYGTAPNTPNYASVAAPTQQMGVDRHDLTSSGVRALVDPHNPLTWFGAFLLVTVGAASVAGSVRLGRAKVSGSVGS